MKNTVFLLLFSRFLVHVSTKDQNCEVKRFLMGPPLVLEAAQNCFGDGSVWRGQLQTRQTSTHITIWWQKLLHNPNCVKGIRLYLDGELVKDLERPDSKQKKIKIPYNRTKCKRHSVLLTVEVDTNESERCYKASMTMTHVARNKNEENCNKNDPRAENDPAVSESAPDDKATTTYTSAPPLEEDGDVGDVGDANESIINFIVGILENAFWNAGFHKVP